MSDPTRRQATETNEQKAETGELSDEQLDAAVGGRSDLGQQLQLALQEANNVYNRSTTASSNLIKQTANTQNQIIKNIS